MTGEGWAGKGRSDRKRGRQVARERSDSLVDFGKESGSNFTCNRQAWKGFEQQSEMIHCERIPLAASGEKAAGTRVNTGSQSGDCCGAQARDSGDLVHSSSGGEDI